MQELPFDGGTADAQRRRDPGVILLLALFLLFLLLATLGGWRLALEAERIEQQSELQSRLGDIDRDINTRIGRYFSLLASGSASLSFLGELSPETWSRFVDSLQLKEAYPLVSSLNFLRRIEASEREVVEQHIRDTIHPRFRIRSTAGSDAVLCVILHSALSGTGERGYDACQSQSPRRVLMEALVSGGPAVSEPLTFQATVEELAAGNVEPVVRGVVIASPVTMRDRAGGTPHGWLTLSLATEAFFEPLISRQDGDRLIVRDVTDADSPRRIHVSRAGETMSSGLEATDVLTLANRQWEVTLRRPFRPGMLPGTVLVAGVLISLLLFFLVRNSYLVRDRARAIAERMTEAWRESEERRQRTEELSLIMVTHVDPEGCWQKVPPRLCQLLQCAEQELLGRPVSESVEPQDRDHFEQARRSLLDGACESRRVEMRLTRPGGQGTWSEVNISLVVSDAAEPLYFLVFIQDVSDRKAWEQELEIRDKLLEAVAKSLNELIAPGHFDASVDKALAVLGRAAGVHRAYIFTNHPHSVTGLPAITMRYEWTREDVSAEIDNPAMKDLPYTELPDDWYDKLNAGMPVRAIPKRLDPAAREMLAAQNIRSLLLVPIMLRGGFQGFIGFDDCETERAWPDSQVSALLAAAASIGNAFDRRETEEALEHNRRLLSSITENIKEGIYRSSAEGRLEYVNSALAEMFGYESPEEMMQVPAPIHYVSPARRKELTDFLEQDGSFRDQEVEFVRRDGSRFVALNSAVAVRGEEDSYYLDGVISDITERKQAERQINYLAHYDTLTDLPNRTLLRDRMEQALAKARRNDALVAVLFIDLDRFKNVNDSLGHAVGDRLLAEVSRRLQRDTREGDTVSRQGGDEFIVLLSDITESNEATRVATKLLSSLSQSYRIGNHELHVTPSIGISVFPDDAEDIDELVRNADAAMYQAKERGRFNFQFFTHDMSVQAWERLSMENQLRRAIKNREFVLYYQPQLSLETGEIIGVEALIRWHHEGQLIGPNVFIPIAEQTGMIIDIGDWVLQAACEQARAWQLEGLDAVPVSVNLSALQFRRGDIRSHVQQALDSSGLAPEYLTLELTESTVMDEVEESVRMLGQLSRLGVGLCIDDFGTGYSSLSYLKRFPIDKLKIDKSFVSDIPRDADDMAITAAVIDMGRNLNLRIVAEGVETREQLHFLRDRGCQEMQGFLFSRPVPVNEMAELLRRRSRLDVAS